MRQLYIMDKVLHRPEQASASTIQWEEQTLDDERQLMK